jgi:hypothetical protein
MTQPEPTPDDIRATIAANPQSQSDRSYLIGKAVEMNMADEIPDSWTVEMFDPDVDVVDDEDLIAENYTIYPLRSKRGGQRFPDDPPYLVSINAHESGLMSISFPPDPPELKFDTNVADRLIGAVDVVRNDMAYNQSSDGVTDHDLMLVEPTTGITVKAVTPPPSSDPTQTEDNTYAVIAIGELAYRLTIETINEWLTGLTAMANTAETYGTEGEKQ